MVTTKRKTSRPLRYKAQLIIIFGLILLVVCLFFIFGSKNLITFPGNDSAVPAQVDNSQPKNESLFIVFRSTDPDIRAIEQRNNLPANSIQPIGSTNAGSVKVPDGIDAQQLAEKLRLDRDIVSASVGPKTEPTN